MATATETWPKADVVAVLRDAHTAVTEAAVPLELQGSAFTWAMQLLLTARIKPAATSPSPLDPVA